MANLTIGQRIDDVVYGPGEIAGFLNPPSEDGLDVHCLFYRGGEWGRKFWLSTREAEIAAQRFADAAAIAQEDEDDAVIARAREVAIGRMVESIGL